jgi:two-component system response regulator HupR/HoxA
MATIVAKTGIKREKGWLYFLDKQGDVSRARMARGGSKAPKGRQKVARCGVDREDGFLYFIDKKGNVAKVKMARSTRRKPARRKSTARRRTTARRTARKTTRKKTARRKTTRKTARRKPAGRTARRKTARRSARRSDPRAGGDPPPARTLSPSLGYTSRVGGHGERVDGQIEGARPSTTHPYGILIVDDEAGILESLSLTLGSDYSVYTASNGEEGLAILEREEIALIIADQVMPAMSGVEFLEKAIERNPHAIRMMLTGYADIGSLVRAINDGRIYRYIAKPWEPDEVRLNVKRALEAYDLATENTQLAAALADANQRLRAENVFLRREVERKYAFDQIIGSSPAMDQVFEVMEKVAETDASVLISGETGTGKDLVARAIHYSGPRKNQRFVAQNCASLPDTLLESELFGHKRGAFTGAHADKKGLFELAHRGTIFLDEVGETHPGMQVRLLRVLQDGEIRPLGASETEKVDVRVIAATNRELRADAESGRFREDLYYRLRVVEIQLPPLRERRSDIPLLAHHFLDFSNRKMGRKIKGFTNEAMDRLVSYGWSGNVRELEHEIERVVALAGEVETVSVEMLSEEIRGALPERVPYADDIGPELTLGGAVDALKRRMILQAIQDSGSKTRAAERLGIPRQSLQKMMKRLGLKG